MLVIPTIIGFVFLVHFIADFIFQSRWQAENKSKDNFALASHIMTYTLIMFIMLLPFFGIMGSSFYALVNGLLHFITDAISSQASSKAYQEKNMKKFWMVIGADQLVHQLCLLFTLFYLIIW